MFFNPIFRIVKETWNPSHTQVTVPSDVRRALNAEIAASNSSLGRVG